MGRKIREGDAIGDKGLTVEFRDLAQLPGNRSPECAKRNSGFR